MWAAFARQIVPILTQTRGCFAAMTGQLMRASTLMGTLLAALAFAAIFTGAAGPSPQRISFVIATGPTSGTYFTVGEAIASLVSHPPGLFRCERDSLCGPAGLIASVKTSPGSVSNVAAVNARTVSAGFAQSDIVREAFAGRPPFRKSGPQTHLRAIGNLFPEEVHLIVAKAAHIRSVNDLAGKRVGIGPWGSGTSITARTIFSAYRLQLKRIKINNDASDIAADELDKGSLDAVFFVGGAPVPLARDLLARGHATLVPIGGNDRKRLIGHDTALTPATIPGDLYPGVGATETVGVHAILLVNDSEPDSLIYGITRALFNPANHEALGSSHSAAQSIRADTATTALPVPLHPGAARYFAEIGKLKRTASKTR